MAAMPDIDISQPGPSVAADDLTMAAILAAEHLAKVLHVPSSAIHVAVTIGGDGPDPVPPAKKPAAKNSPAKKPAAKKAK
jgi:hypothetical protein